MERRSKLLWGTGLIVGAVVAGFLLWKLIITPPPPSSEVRVMLPTIVASLPHYVAESQGIYSKYGLRITPTTVESSNDMMQALIGGQVDFLPAVSLVPVVNAYLAAGSDKPGFYIISHSRMEAEPAFDQIVVPVASSVSSLKDLEGRRIAVYPGTTSERIVRYYLRTQGVDVRQIQFVRLPPSQHRPALERGEVAASHTYEWFRTAMLREGNFRAISQSVYGSISDHRAGVIGVSVISRDLLEKRPTVAQALLNAWDESIEFIEQHDHEARAVLEKQFKLPHDVALNCTWVGATSTKDISITDVYDFVAKLQAMGEIAPGTVKDVLFYKRK